MTGIRSFSFGGGKQSMAVLVLAAQGKVVYDYFLFCNVGHDSENPETIRYYNEVALPFALDNNIKMIEVWREWKRGPRKGQRETVYGRVMGDNRSIPIPARMSGNGAPGQRACTLDFKIRVVHDFLKKRGATVDSPATVGLGISLDEIERARTDSGFDDQLVEYPLLDLRMTRNDCIKVIQEAGLPVPPKSACYFCPFKSRAEWTRQKKDQPDLFAKSVEIEARINEKRGSLGKDFVYLHPDLVPLDRAVGDQLTMLDEVEDNCESGYCMT